MKIQHLCKLKSKPIEMVDEPGWPGTGDVKTHFGYNAVDQRHDCRRATQNLKFKTFRVDF